MLFLCFNYFRLYACTLLPWQGVGGGGRDLWNSPLLFGLNENTQLNAELFSASFSLKPGGRLISIIVYVWRLRPKGGTFSDCISI